MHLSSLYFGNTFSCSGTRTQHDVLAQLNKLILAQKKKKVKHKPIQGYKLQISITVSLFKWTGSSFCFMLSHLLQPKIKQSTFSTIYGSASKNLHLFEYSISYMVNSTCLWKQIQIDFMHIYKCMFQ